MRPNEQGAGQACRHHNGLTSASFGAEPLTDTNRRPSSTESLLPPGSQRHESPIVPVSKEEAEARFAAVQKARQDRRRALKLSRLPESMGGLPMTDPKETFSGLIAFRRAFREGCEKQDLRRAQYRSSKAFLSAEVRRNAKRIRAQARRNMLDREMNRVIAELEPGEREEGEEE